MGMIRGGANDSIQRLFLFHHFPEVDVFGYFEIGRLLLEMLFYYLLYRAPSCFKTIIKVCEIPVVGGISNGGHLNIIQFQQIGGILPAFATCPDDPYVDFVAGGDKSVASEHVARYNHKSCGR